jgi:hypothetical protein
VVMGHTPCYENLAPFSSVTAKDHHGFKLLLPSAPNARSYMSVRLIEVSNLN